MGTLIETFGEMMKTKSFKYVKHFSGFPKATDLELVEEELSPLKDEEFLAEAVYLSVDPYMRAFSAGFPIGETMVGYQVAKIIETKNSKFPLGKYVVGGFGWRTHTISNGKGDSQSFLSQDPYLVEDCEDFSLSSILGVLGPSGFSAYHGFLEICTPEKGETVVVSAAAGSVGSLVGQIAKIKGCTVIGIAGSVEKGNWLLNELGFDGFINYKTEDIHEKLSKLAPRGVDCYFDNVGGNISSIVLRHMNDSGRISVCGLISEYNEEEKKGNHFIEIQSNLTLSTFKFTKILIVNPIICILKRKPYTCLIAKEFYINKTTHLIYGFLCEKWYGRTDGRDQLIQWLKEGRIKYQETKTKGFDKMFAAFVDILNGRNCGKAIVEV
nr:prostaglandin reductase 1-like [Leptinotarsa decemlineata]